MFVLQAIRSILRKVENIRLLLRDKDYLAALMTRVKILQYEKGRGARFFVQQESKRRKKINQLLLRTARSRFRMHIRRSQTSFWEKTCEIFKSLCFCEDLCKDLVLVVRHNSKKQDRRTAQSKILLGVSFRIKKTKMEFFASAKEYSSHRSCLLLLVVSAAE